MGDVAVPPARPQTAGDTTAENPWPVRVLTRKIAGYVERMPLVWVEGQVLQLTARPGSRTTFLTLRDSDVDLSLSVTAPTALLGALGRPLAEGDRVVVRAKPSFYEPRGVLQLEARDVRAVGVGELLARIEELRRTLAAEGLFDSARKQALPFLPRGVGVVCGRASAAERDVVAVATRRWPAVRLQVRAVATQGPHAVGECVAALRSLDVDPGVDVIVLTRGGGSVEDLLPFSNEALVRAVSASRTPVVAAIGHESDTPLVDLVADVRAATPTDAAKRVVPDVVEEAERVRAVRRRARQAVAGLVQRERQALDAVRSRPVMADPGVMVQWRRDEVASLRARADRCVDARLGRAADEVGHLRGRVQALSPAATLARGYAVVTDPAGHVVTDGAAVGGGALLRVRLAVGALGVVVERVEVA